jgi:hypothetical protein
MTAKLRAVGLSDLLDSVRRDHSALPEPSLLIVSLNSPAAAWRFNSPIHQCSIHARGSEHSSWSSTQGEL